MWNQLLIVNLNSFYLIMLTYKDLGHLYPILTQLNRSHNFTIESQVQLHAPLAFDPPSDISPAGEACYLLGEDELKIFINSAEWTLCKNI